LKQTCNCQFYEAQKQELPSIFEYRNRSWEGFIINKTLSATQEIPNLNSNNTLINLLIKWSLYFQN